MYEVDRVGYRNLTPKPAGMHLHLACMQLIMCPKGVVGRQPTQSLGIALLPFALQSLVEASTINNRPLDVPSTPKVST